MSNLKRTKHPQYQIPESRFDDLPRSYEDPKIRSISAKDLLADSEQIVSALQSHGFFIIKGGKEFAQDIMQPLYNCMRDFFGREIAEEREMLISRRSHALTETVDSKKYPRSRSGAGYTRIFFDNYINKRDPEERDIFEIHYNLMDKTIFPEGDMHKLSQMLYERLFELGLESLRAIAQGMGLTYEDFSKLVSPSQDPITPKDNERSNLCLFRYQDDTNLYTSTQRCMVHRDEGLLTFLPRSTATGIEILSMSQTHFIPIEEFMDDDDVLVFPGLTMEYITQGCLRGAIHRVVREPGKDRYSTPFELKAHDHAQLFKLKTDFILKSVDNYESTNTNVYEPAVFGATCDSCEKTIVGVRHKCKECLDYDLCDTCLKTPGSHDHEFFKVTKDLPFTAGDSELKAYQFEYMCNFQRRNQSQYRINMHHVVGVPID